MTAMSVFYAVTALGAVTASIASGSNSSGDGSCDVSDLWSKGWSVRLVRRGRWRGPVGGCRRWTRIRCRVLV